MFNGDRVQIFSDPITCTKPEGEAILIALLGEGERVEAVARPDSPEQIARRERGEHPGTIETEVGLLQRWKVQIDDGSPDAGMCVDRDILVVLRGKQLIQWLPGGSDSDG